jgi:glycerophosphoryl diester phosphodiesterase
VSLPRLIAIVAWIVSAMCVLLLASLVVFDAQAERFTAGKTPRQFDKRLEAQLRDDYTDVLGVAHNAGDDTGAAFEAGAYGVDAIEIDVTSVGGELHASHDAPVPVIDTLLFRGPELEEAWDAAALRDTVVLHLKETSAGYLEDVSAFLRARRDGPHVIIQTGDPASLRVMRRTVPSADRLLLVFSERGLQRLRRDPALRDVLDGVSVRERLLTPEEHRRLEDQGLRTFAWTVNDEERMNELIEQGLDGLITDRLDIMRLLGDNVSGTR